MKLKCNLCGETFFADDFYAEIEAGGAVLVRCPNGCNLIDVQLENLCGDIKEILTEGKE